MKLSKLVLACLVATTASFVVAQQPDPNKPPPPGAKPPPGGNMPPQEVPCHLLAVNHHLHHLAVCSHLQAVSHPHPEAPCHRHPPAASHCLLAHLNHQAVDSGANKMGAHMGAHFFASSGLHPAPNSSCHTLQKFQNLCIEKRSLLNAGNVSGIWNDDPFRAGDLLVH